MLTSSPYKMLTEDSTKPCPDQDPRRLVRIERYGFKMP
jgi:hypothetical protein